MNSPKQNIPVGLLFSLEGPYRVVGRAMYWGAILAINEINHSSQFDFKLIPHTYDPQGSLAKYSKCAEELLETDGLRHVIGCYTSSSRKAIIPTFEKNDALLWYPSHYEGFETNDNVIYLGASPNHHIVPLIRYVIDNIGNSIYCIGSNYIWAWENTRIVRQLTQKYGGTVVGERYLQIDDLDVERIIEEIKVLHPDFILNTLIGESSYSLYRGLQRLQENQNKFKNIKIGSCTLCEPELAKIGKNANTGLISSSVYFASIDSDCNREFTNALYSAHNYQAHSIASADAEASYNTVHMMAEAFQRAGTSNLKETKESLYKVERRAPQGRIRIDPDNNHSYLTPRIAISDKNQKFNIIWSAQEPVRPDPYLTWTDNHSIYHFSKAKNRNGTEYKNKIRVIR